MQIIRISHELLKSTWNYLTKKPYKKSPELFQIFHKFFKHFWLICKVEKSKQ